MVQVLHIAVLKQRIAVVDALLDIGFLSMHPNSKGWLALDEAVALKHEPLVSTFLVALPSNNHVLRLSFAPTGRVFTCLLIQARAAWVTRILRKDINERSSSRLATSSVGLMA